MRKQTLVSLALCAVLVLGVAGGLRLFFPEEADGRYPALYVVTIPDSPRIATFAIIPRTDDEPPGLAHYTEHLTWLNMERPGETTGGDSHANAWTNSYVMIYRLDGPEEELPDIFEGLARAFLPLDVEEGFAREERDIVQREYDITIGNSVDMTARLAMNDFLYAGNGLAVPVIGTPEDIAGLEYEAARRYHARTHRPGNAVIVVIGNVTRRQITDVLDAMPANGVSQASGQMVPLVFHLADMAHSVQYIDDPMAAPRVIWRRIVPLDERREYGPLMWHLTLLEEILASGLPGGLSGPLHLDAAIINSFQLQLDALDERHVELTIVAQPDQGVALSQLVERFEETLAQIAASGIPPQTFERVTARFARQRREQDNDAARGKALARHTLAWLFSCRTPLPEAVLVRLQEEASLGTLDQILARLAGPGRTAITFIGAQGEWE